MCKFENYSFRIAIFKLLIFKLFYQLRNTFRCFLADMGYAVSINSELRHPGVYHVYGCMDGGIF